MYCIHCISKISDKSRDHLLPKKWYPPHIKLDSDLITVPSCVSCNSKYGRLEDKIRTVLGMCMPPDDPVTHSIVKSVMRSYNPMLGKSIKDTGHRVRKNIELRKNLLFLSRPIEQGLIPAFGVHPNTDYQGGYGMIKLAAKDINKLGIKFARGAIYHFLSSYTQGDKIEIGLTSEDAANKVFDIAVESNCYYYKMHPIYQFCLLDNYVDSNFIIVFSVWNKLHYRAYIDKNEVFIINDEDQYEYLYQENKTTPQSKETNPS